MSGGAVVILQRARERAECREIIESYVFDKSDVSGMQEFANCVALTHPAEATSAAGIIIALVAFLVAFLVVFLGLAYYNIKSY